MKNLTRYNVIFRTHNAGCMIFSYRTPSVWNALKIILAYSPEMPLGSRVRLAQPTVSAMVIMAHYFYTFVLLCGLQLQTYYIIIHCIYCSQFFYTPDNITAPSRSFAKIWMRFIPGKICQLLFQLVILVFDWFNV